MVRHRPPTGAGFPPIPKCGPARYPELEGRVPYKTGLGLRVAPEQTAQGAAALKPVCAGHAWGDLPGGWADGFPGGNNCYLNQPGLLPAVPCGMLAAAWGLP